MEVEKGSRVKHVLIRINGVTGMSGAASSNRSMPPAIHVSPNYPVYGITVILS